MWQSADESTLLHNEERSVQLTPRSSPMPDARGELPGRGLLRVQSNPSNPAALFWQAVAKDCQQRSRIAQRLNVQGRVRSTSSLAAAFLTSLRATLLPLETLKVVRFQLGERVCQHTVRTVYGGLNDLRRCLRLASSRSL